MSDTTRLIINLPTSLVSSVRELAKRHGLSMAQVIACALITQAYLESKRALGAKIVVAYRDGTMNEIVFDDT